MKYVTSSIVLFSGGLLVGVLIGALARDSLNLTWKGDIGPEPFVNIFIAVAVAVFLNHSIQRGMEVTKTESSMVIQPLQDSCSVLREMNFDFQECYKSKNERGQFVEKFVSNNRKFSNSLTVARELAVVLDLKPEAKKFEELQLEATLYKQLTTGSDPEQPFDNSDYTKHRERYSILNKLILEMVVRIGRRKF